MSDTKTLQIEACGSLVFSGMVVRLSPDTNGLKTMKAKHNACADAVRQLNKTPTNGDTKLLYAIRDYVVSEGITNTTMSKTVEVKNDNKTSGFNIGNQAYHILSDVLNAVKAQLTVAGRISETALKQGCADLVEACWPESDDEEEYTFDIGSSDTTPSVDDFDDDDLDNDENTEASVSGSFISIDDIKAKALEPSVVENALALYTNDDNVDDNGGFFRFFNGKSRKSLRLTPNRKNRSPLEQFKASTLYFNAINLSGLCANRKNTNNDTVFLDIPSDQLLASQKLASAVMVLSGVTRFNHDLRKYISDDTIDRIRSGIFGDNIPDGSDLKAKDGWFMPYQRGNRSSSTPVVDEAHTMNVINLL